MFASCEQGAYAAPPSSTSTMDPLDDHLPEDAMHLMFSPRQKGVSAEHLRKNQRRRMRSAVDELCKSNDCGDVIVQLCQDFTGWYLCLWVRAETAERVRTLLSQNPIRGRTLTCDSSLSSREFRAFHPDAHQLFFPLSALTNDEGMPEVNLGIPETGKSEIR